MISQHTGAHMRSKGSLYKELEEMKKNFHKKFDKFEKVQNEMNALLKNKLISTQFVE